jgi:DNA-binding transcriptional LysR family regulator
MSLSSQQLDAFLAIIKLGSFSKAAKSLFITQSALSHRIKKLEEELGTSVLVRESSGVQVTALGEALLQYCNRRENLESEFLGRIKTGSPTIQGALKIAGFSTVMRSVVIPSLDSILSAHPGIQLEIFTRETRDLPKLLRTSQAEYVFLNDKLSIPGIENHSIGEEVNVLVESALRPTLRDVYLDHDIDDMTTEQFFQLQSKRPRKIERSFLDEIYTIIDCVSRGYGRAVVPMHLIGKNNQVRIVAAYRPLRVPIYFSYFKKTYYSQLEQIVIESIVQNAPQFLALKKVGTRSKSESRLLESALSLI